MQSPTRFSGPPARYCPPAPYPYGDQGMGGLKKVLRKVAGPVLAVAAVASGQPQLAVPAYNAGKAATKKKAKAQQIDPALLEPPPPASWFDSLLPADRNALLIGGTIVGTLLVARLVGGGRR